MADLVEALKQMFSSSTAPQRDPLVDALIDQYGEEGAYYLIGRARTGEKLQPSEQRDLRGIDDLVSADRELEGSLSGLGVIPAALAYEYMLKPVSKYSAGSDVFDINTILPEGYKYQEGVTSPSRFENVAAATRGAFAGGRVLPKTIEDMIYGLVQ